MSIKFEQGQTYHVVKALGVVTKEDGRLQISQRLGKEGISDIQPTENLTFAGRDGGKLWFTREDGSKVCGHRSHFDPEDAYNVADAEGMTREDRLVRAKSKVAKAEKEVEAAAARLAELMKEAGEELPPAEETTGNEQATGEGYIAPSTDARAEAAALFATANG